MTRDELDELLTQIQMGTAEIELVKQLICPVCGQALFLSFNPKGTEFGVECVNPMHYFTTKCVETPPLWWEQFIRRLWLD